MEWSLAMTIFTPKPTFQSPFTVPNHDGWIILGYAIFSVVFFTAVYLATGGPGMPDADFVVAMAIP